MKNEVWKPVVGYEELYEISNLGRIKSNDRIINDNGGTFILKGKILKQQTHYHGYLYVMLSGILKKKKYIHRLVAEAFISNPNNYSEVNHKDGNKLNNSVENLEWCNRQHNVLHSYRTGLLKPKKGKEVYNAKAVDQYDKQDNFIRSWDCIKDASRHLKMNDVIISNCCKGKQKTAGGYVWKYKN